MYNKGDNNILIVITGIYSLVGVSLSHWLIWKIVDKVEERQAL